jgi:phage tail sheath protein FI
LVGTAPDADPDLFPLNTPVPVFADALKAGQLKSAGTLLDGVDAIYSQKSAVVVVVTRVAEGEPGRDLVRTLSVRRPARPASGRCSRRVRCSGHPEAARRPRPHQRSPDQRPANLNVIA